MASRAPKQWALSRNETITSFEAWRNNLQYTLSLDHNFATFLVEDFKWEKKSGTNPLRGLTDDGEAVPEARRRTAAQKCAHLDLMLGQIASYCPIIARSQFVQRSTSMNSIWQAIRAHFGFQTSGSRFLDFNDIKLEPGEKPEDIFQRLTCFVEDNLLRTDGGIKHHNETPTSDEELSPTTENIIVLTWLRLIHPELPALIKQRYGTELRSQTLASLKPEISLAVSSLLDELHSVAEVKVLRASFKEKTKLSRKNEFSKKVAYKSCVLCKQAGRPSGHYLSKCMYLPDSDRQYISKTRMAVCEESPSDGSDDDSLQESAVNTSITRSVSTLRRVSTNISPYFKAFYKHYPLHITLDTGAEVNMNKATTAQRIGAVITKSSQGAHQADGVTPLEVIGETRLTMTRNDKELYLEALVVSDLDTDVLAGTPFMSQNDVSARPAKQEITIHGTDKLKYGSTDSEQLDNRVRRAKATILRAQSGTIWPGDYVELDVPSDFTRDCLLAVEPRYDNTPRGTLDWPKPHIAEAIAGKIRLFNDTQQPQLLRKNDHVCQVVNTLVPYLTEEDSGMQTNSSAHFSTSQTNHSALVKLDPDQILSSDTREQFKQLLREHVDVFSPKLSGYNGAEGAFEAVVNMGPTQPPQRKGRLPQYSRNKLVELQDKFDELEKLGVFRRPEEVCVSVEYLNPSFLVKKSSGGFRLVTAFGEVGQYSKPQPSLLPDVNSIIVADLTSAFYQIPLSRDSMKYCGVATPFRGVRVYTKSAMGMPGSETALEELMCRVLGDCLQEGFVAKLADDLYCGGNSPEELINNWTKVLQALQKCNLKLSPSKTIICPQSTTVLGWVWKDGHLSASPHKVVVLSTCSPPSTVRDLRAFLGAYKMLARVLPGCASYLAALEDATSSRESRESLVWTEGLLHEFKSAQQALSGHKSITIPKADDKLWIVTDASVSKHGIGATLYANRNDKLLPAGFFSAKLKKHQVTWLPCEVEALSIGTAIKHFAPFIIQSKHVTSLLTDSKPCVQAIKKLYRGEFSASPRVTSFLSIVSRYQVHVQHLSGSANIPSDFASRNAAECQKPRCQVCTFIHRLEESVVRSVCFQDIIGNNSRLPFTSRSAWKDLQAECPDLRRTSAHLKQGTRPSRKQTKVKDIKRYLNVASIANDGLLVVKRSDPLLPPADLTIVPRSVQDGLITALHLKLNHSTRNQLLLVVKRHFYGLDISKTIDKVCDSCHTCASLKHFPESLAKQSSEDPPEGIGLNFAADVMKQNRPLVLVVRETVSSYTSASIINDEKHDTLRDSLVSLMTGMHPINGPKAVVRVDPAPGFVSLKNDKFLEQHNISLQIGRAKNDNKNPVAEKAISELESEMLRMDFSRGPLTPVQLSICVSQLNSRIRNQGLSSREIWTHRDQFTNQQIPVID